VVDYSAHFKGSLEIAGQMKLVGAKFDLISVTIGICAFTNTELSSMLAISYFKGGGGPLGKTK